MKPNPPRLRPLLAALVMAASAAALADERADLERLRATTLGLIEALVEGGVITRDRADAMLRAAEERARQVPAGPTTGAAEAGRDGKRVVRVPYVPESMKRELREQIREEVLAQAREERWANPNALPNWLDRLHFEGDLRLRADSYRLDRANTPAGAANANGALTRGADLVPSLAGVVPGVNTGEDFSRLRLRARLAADAKLSDTVQAGLRISTGGTTGPTSTNQTLGQGFNRYTLVLDRGWIAYKPVESLTLVGGRIANPFFSTDLVWADDLGFEGVAAKWQYRVDAGLELFGTAGWFPLRTDSPQVSGPRHLAAVQGGLAWRNARGSELRLGAALYQYHNMVGRQEDAARYNLGAPASDYGTREEYPAGLRQRGNTLFLVNAAGDLTQPNFYGLASEFRSLNLTGALDIATFDPVHLVFTADYVRNLAFDRQALRSRTGTNVDDGRATGYMLRGLVGHPQMRERGDWNVSLAWRWLGSDAVLDAFTNSDFGLGGTNNKGFILGANLGIDKNAWVSLRWMSSRPIDSMAPRIEGVTTTPTRLAVDLLQVDFNARF